MSESTNRHISLTWSSSSSSGFFSSRFTQLIEYISVSVDEMECGINVQVKWSAFASWLDDADPGCRMCMRVHAFLFFPCVFFSVVLGGVSCNILCVAVLISISLREPIVATKIFQCVCVCWSQVFFHVLFFFVFCTSEKKRENRFPGMKISVHSAERWERKKKQTRCQWVGEVQVSSKATNHIDQSEMKVQFIMTHS